MIEKILLTALVLSPLNALAIDSGLLYEQGKAHLYCELTCKDDTTARKTGAYRQVDDGYYNLGGIWVEVGSYFDRVYLVSDKKAEDANNYCKSQQSALKAQDRNIRNWLRVESDVKCRVKAYATIAVVGWVSGKAYSVYNHRIVARKSVIEGLKNQEPFDLALASKVEEIKKAHPEYEDSPVLDFSGIEPAKDDL